MSTLRWATCIVIVALLLSFGCGDSGSSGTTSDVSAPGSLRARIIDCTITSGSGIFATTGTLKIFFLLPSSPLTYEIELNGVEVVHSSGTYTYTADGDVGTMNFTDSVIGDGAFVFTYTMRDPKVGEATTSSGTYSANAAAGGTQAGTFVSTEPPVKPPE